MERALVRICVGVVRSCVGVTRTRSSEVLPHVGPATRGARHQGWVNSDPLAPGALSLLSCPYAPPSYPCHPVFQHIPSSDPPPYITADGGHRGVLGLLGAWPGRVMRG